MLSQEPVKLTVPHFYLLCIFLSVLLTPDSLVCLGFFFSYYYFLGSLSVNYLLAPLNKPMVDFNFVYNKQKVFIVIKGVN